MMLESTCELISGILTLVIQHHGDVYYSHQGLDRAHDDFKAIEILQKITCELDGFYYIKELFPFNSHFKNLQLNK